MQSKFSLLEAHLSFELIPKLFVVLLGSEFFYECQDTIALLFSMSILRQLMLILGQQEGADS